MLPVILFVRACGREVKIVELVRDSLVPQAHLDTHGQEKVWIIIVDSYGLTWRSHYRLIAGADQFSFLKCEPENGLASPPSSIMA